MENCELCVFINKILKFQGNLSLVAAAIQDLLSFQLSGHLHNVHMPTKEVEAFLVAMVWFPG